MSATKTPAAKWLCTGRKIFPAMLDVLHATQKSIRLETYIFADGKLGRQILDALITAAQRDVRIISAHFLLARIDPFVACGNFGR